MPLPLNQMHPLDVLYQACRAYPGGIEALAARLGKSPSILYNKLRQQVQTHYVGYDDELSEILFCLRDAGVVGWDKTISAFCWRHGFVVVPFPDLGEVSDDELMEMVLRVVKEQGDVAAALTAALAPNSDGGHDISRREFCAIDKEISEAMAALAELRERVKVRATDPKRPGSSL